MYAWYELVCRCVGGERSEHYIRKKTAKQVCDSPTRSRVIIPMMTDMDIISPMKIVDKKTSMLLEHLYSAHTRIWSTAARTLRRRPMAKWNAGLRTRGVSN